MIFIKQIVICSRSQNLNPKRQFRTRQHSGFFMRKIQYPCLFIAIKHSLRITTFYLCRVGD
nr:MAG TPA: hypothetical protein [Caudoviricetes sp.]